MKIFTHQKHKLNWKDEKDWKQYYHNHTFLIEILLIHLTASDELEVEHIFYLNIFCVHQQTYIRAYNMICIFNSKKCNK